MDICSAKAITKREKRRKTDNRNFSVQKVDCMRLANIIEGRRGGGEGKEKFHGLNISCFISCLMRVMVPTPLYTRAVYTMATLAPAFSTCSAC